MRVLITGASGCIGAWVTKQLLEQGHEIVIYDQVTEPVRLRHIAPADAIAKIRFITGSIEDTESVKRVVREEAVTHIVHLAAVLMPFCQQNPVKGALIDVIGTLNVFEAARDAMLNSGRYIRVVYASSSAVWGPEDAYDGRAVSDSDPLLPATHYGVFKQSNEGNARVFYTANEISSVGLRPWAVYGFGRDGGLTADPSLALKAVAKGEKFHIRLSGFMDLQYVEDVAGIFIGCLFSDKQGAYAFNLAGDIVSMDDFGSKVEEVRPGAGALITNGGATVTVNYKMKAEGLLDYLDGVVPRTPLEEGIAGSLEIFDRLAASGQI